MTKNWDRVKGTLHELYMEKNLKLDDMIRIMKESYDFSASPRGYKKKFKQWGWLKNAPRVPGRKLSRRGTDASSPLEDNSGLEILSDVAVAGRQCSPKLLENAGEPAQTSDGPVSAFQYNGFFPLRVGAGSPGPLDTGRDAATDTFPQMSSASSTSPKRRMREQTRPLAHPYIRPQPITYPGRQRGSGSLDSISVGLTGMGIDSTNATPMAMQQPPLPPPSPSLSSPSYPNYTTPILSPYQSEQIKVSSIQFAAFKTHVIDPSLAEFPTYQLNPPRLKTDFIEEMSKRVLQTAQMFQQKNDFHSAAVVLLLGLCKITHMTVDPNELFSTEPDHLVLAQVMGKFVDNASWENVYLFRNGFMLALLLSTSYERTGDAHDAIYVLEQTLKAVLMSRVGILTAGEEEEGTLESMFEFADKDCSRVLQSIIRIRELRECTGGTAEHKAVMVDTFSRLERFLAEWESAFGVLGVLNLVEFLDGLLGLAKRHRMEAAATALLRQILSKGEKVLVSGGSGSTSSGSGGSENFRWISARHFSRISRRLSALYEMSGQALAGIHLLKRASKIVGSNHNGHPPRKEKQEIFEATSAQAKLQEHSGLWDAADKVWKQLRGILDEREDFELTMKADVAIAELLVRNDRQGEVLVFLEHRINECLKNRVAERPSVQRAFDDAEPIFRAILSLAKLRFSGAVTVSAAPPAMGVYYRWILSIKGLNESEKTALAHKLLELLTELQVNHPDLAWATLILYDEFLPSFIDLSAVTTTDPPFPQNTPHHTSILQFLSLIYSNAGKYDQPRLAISHIVTALSLLYETRALAPQASTSILLYAHSLTSAICSSTKARLCEECKVDEFTTAVSLAEHYERLGSAHEGSRVIARIIDEAEAEFLIPATKGWVGFGWLKVLVRIAKFYMRRGQSAAAMDVLERVHRASVELGDWDRRDASRKVEQFGVFDESRGLLVGFAEVGAVVLCRCECD